MALYTKCFFSVLFFLIDTWWWLSRPEIGPRWSVVSAHEGRWRPKRPRVSHDGRVRNGRSSWRWREEWRWRDSRYNSWRSNSGRFHFHLHGFGQQLLVRQLIEETGLLLLLLRRGRSYPHVNVVRRKELGRKCLSGRFAHLHLHLLLLYRADDFLLL